MPWEVWNCSNTIKSIVICASYSEYGAIETSRDEIFIGISFELHVGLGGHIKLGFVL